MISANYQLGSENKFAAIRYLANGLLDSAFGTNGFVVTNITPTNNNSTTAEIGVQSSGKIIVAGNNTENGIKRFTLVRYHDTLSINTFVQRVEENQISLTVYPNPASDILKVSCYSESSTSFEAPMSLRVFSSLGIELTSPKYAKTVQRDKVLSLELSIKDLLPGLYFIKIGSATARFVKE
ncbi:MAG: T9SS type A sorting domain-containing protein [Bacteroidia bacterium]|nr:T9SS type A sorting domain-containing protein [Bacteroidia bacterium]